MKSFVRSLILLPLAAIAAPGEKDKDDPNAPGQLLQKDPTDLSGELPGMPSAGQGEGRLCDDGFRKAPRRRR